MTTDELNVRICVTADGVDEATNEAANSLRKVAREAENANNATQDSAAAQAAAWASVSAAAATAFGKICGAVNKGIEYSNAYKNALKGLDSVASGRGIGSEAMRTALEGVTDNFFDASAAATSFKNLLSRGYTLEQATQTITRLKDSASFGRQASLSLKDAVVSATEGLRNENSILVDNAGVTKNVSVMWKEYAASIGVGVQNLTQAQKIEAEYQGVMRETQHQVGDLQKLSEGLAGSQAEAAMQTEQAYRALGEAMTPVVGAGAEMQTGLMTALTGAAEACPALTAGLTSAAAAMMGLTAGVTALNAAKTLFSKISMSASVLGPLGALAGVLGVVAMAYTGIKQAQEEAARAEEERMQKSREAVAEQQGRVERLAELTERYKELASKQDLGFAEHQEMVAIQNELASAYGVTAGNVDGLTSSLQKYLAMLSETQKKELDALLVKQTAESQRAYLATYAGDMKNLYTDVQMAAESFAKAQKDVNDEIWKTNNNEPEAAYREKLAMAENELNEAKARLKAHENLYSDWAKAAAEEGATAIQIAGGEVNNALKETLLDMFTMDLNEFGGDRNAANAYVDNWVSMVKEAVSDPAISEALGGMQETVSNAMQGFAPNDEQIKAFADGWALLTGEDSPIRTLLTLLADHTEDATDSAETLLTSLLGLNDGVSLLGENGQAFQGTFENVKYMLQGLAGEAESSQSAAEKLSQAYDWASGSFEENTKRGRELYNEYKKQADILRKNSAESKTLEKGQSALNKAKKDGAKLSTAEQSDLKAVGKLVGYQGQNYDVLQGKIKQYGTKLASETSAAQGSVQALSGELVNAAACSNIDATVQVDCSGAVSAIQGLIAIAQAALAILSALGVAKSGGGGGGGGGGKKDGGYDAEAAARAAEQARKEAIQRDYDLIEHKRHMNEITLEQELAMIEKIRTAHRLNAEEIMEWEEKIYDVKQEIRERDAESIDTLADGVVTALEARYEAMRSAELERLDASREAWETWRDDSVAAIEDQIAALEKLSDTEDREKKDAEELRKIEKLRRDVAYEQDDFNRMKLQKQLDDALEDREERLRKLALEDQKEALRAEIERINERADEQLTALDKEQEGIEAAYDERLKEAALNAEAEKLMMVKSQDEIMSLLREYVPEYNALGQSMGEKLLDGFKSKVGDVVNWFKDFNAGITAMQEQLAQTTNAAAESLYQGYGARQSGRSGAGAAGVAVNQTVNFYEPVESPSQVARRMEDVNDALGVMMG